MATMGRTAGKFDARLSILAGVSIFALSMWKHAHFTTDSGMSDFFWPLIFRGVGLGLIFVPLTNLALADLPMSKIPNGTGLFNLMRQLGGSVRSEEHTSELQSRLHLVCRLLLEKKKKKIYQGSLTKQQ